MGTTHAGAGLLDGRKKTITNRTICGSKELTFTLTMIVSSSFGWKIMVNENTVSVYSLRENNVK